MVEAMKARTLADILAAQRTIPVTMRDKSGNLWEFEMSAICAATIDAQDRFHPLPMPKQKRDAEGRPMTDDAGAPVMDADNPEYTAAFMEAMKARRKAAVAAAIPADFFGPACTRIVAQVAALENLFNYDEIKKAANAVTAASIVNARDIAEARQDVDPFVSTGDAPATVEA